MNFQKIFQPHRYANEEGNTLNVNNQNLRQDLYIIYSNTKQLQKLYRTVISEFVDYTISGIITPDLTRDILYSLFDKKATPEFCHMEKNKCEVNIISRPLFNRIKTQEDCQKWNVASAHKISQLGYQHLYMLSSMTDSSTNSSGNSSDSSDCASDGNTQLKKRLKTCQTALNVDCDSLLEVHHSNATKITGNVLRVDILIFLDRVKCKEIATFLGLIYIEDLLHEIGEGNINNLMSRLTNKNPKLYRLLQSYINKHLMKGCNNICLTHTRVLWNNTKANARGVIHHNTTNMVLGYAFRDAAADANFSVTVESNANIFDYIEAIGSIINNSLHCDVSVSVSFEGEPGVCREVALPLISIVPLYILRYFAQSEIVQNTPLLKLVYKS